MDAAAVLEQYVSDLVNLPAEVAHVLEEIGDKDVKFYETRKRIQQRDNQIHKFIKTHGSLADNPKESQAYPKIRADFEKAMALQQQKLDLANTGLYIVSKHMKRLNDDISRLESEGMLAPVAANETFELTSSETSSRQASVRGSRPSSAQADRKNSPAAASSRGSTPASQAGGRPLKRQKVQPTVASAAASTPASTAVTSSLGPPIKSEDDEVLYCTCQRISFGNMVACDNPDCQYEWFHYECVGLTSPPSGTWYCPTCSKDRKEKDFKDSSRKKRG